jgi:hypothetical protein
MNVSARMGMRAARRCRSINPREKANAGFKAVSVVAEIEDGAAQADIALLKGTESKHVDEKL